MFVPSLSWEIFGFEHKNGAFHDVFRTAAACDNDRLLREARREACQLAPRAEGETSSGGRSKHIDVKFRYIAENVRNGEVCVRYIPTSWNYADMMTKPLGKIQFRRVRDMCVAPEASGVQDSGEKVDMEVEMANLIYELEGY